MNKILCITNDELAGAVVVSNMEDVFAKYARIQIQVVDDVNTVQEKLNSGEMDYVFTNRMARMVVDNSEDEQAVRDAYVAFLSK